jgi:polyisoprenyl-phosphate glycosyltransferase
MILIRGAHQKGQAIVNYPVFLSVVVVVKNQADALGKWLPAMSAALSALAADHELILVDNASQDNSIATLKQLTAEDGLPNVQVYALTKEIDNITAAWVGLENALGDFVAVFDPMTDDIDFLPRMLHEAVSGADVVFACNTLRRAHSPMYRIAFASFNFLYKRFGGIDLAQDAPQYRVLSKRVINFLLQHTQPSMSYRHLPATGGFARVNLTYSAQPKAQFQRHLGSSVDMGMRLLVSTTRAPMRVVMGLSMFGALANLVYSAYVIAVALLKTDVAPGWVTLSLQQSGMFFLLSMVLMVLGEYILQMASLSNEGPLYHVAQEFSSARITRREKLNIEDAAPSSPMRAFR